MKNHHNKRKDFIHHQDTISTSIIRESVFGIEDGIVSTFGAILGIATATHDVYIVMLTGFVIISVESISMGVGSFISSRSERDIEERKIREEKSEIKNYPKLEEKEMVELFVHDGWPKKIAKQMAQVASKNKKLLLKEMAYRELKVFPDKLDSPGKNAFAMWISYIVGGIIPLSSYLLFSIDKAIIYSIPVTLLALFGIGAYTTKFSKRSWVKAGLEMMILASLAAIVGYGVGQFVTGL
jgi:vacuolar iron transporter family protein